MYECLILPSQFSEEPHQTWWVFIWDWSDHQSILAFSKVAARFWAPFSIFFLHKLSEFVATGGRRWTKKSPGWVGYSLVCIQCSPHNSNLVSTNFALFNIFLGSHIGIRHNIHREKNA